MPYPALPNGPRGLRRASGGCELSAPPVVPTPVLVDVLQGHGGRDAVVNRFLETRDLDPEVPEALARRAAELRALARRGSAIDALVVASGEPGALAAHARGVIVERV